jgi:hypothetical protein
MVGELKMMPRRGSSRTAATPIDCLFPGKKETGLIVYKDDRPHAAELLVGCGWAAQGRGGAFMSFFYDIRAL